MNDCRMWKERKVSVTWDKAQQAPSNCEHPQKQARVPVAEHWLQGPGWQGRGQVWGHPARLLPQTLVQSSHRSAGSPACTGHHSDPLPGTGVWNTTSSDTKRLSKVFGLLGLQAKPREWSVRW